MRYALALLLAIGLPGCLSSGASRAGEEALRRGDVDEAVARLEEAAGERPEDVAIRIALMRARLEAAQYHRELARALLDAGAWERGAEELARSLDLDPTNRYAAEQLAEVERLLEEGPPPPLSPAEDPLPDTLLSLEFEDTSLRAVLETLAELAGVNILFDEAYRDRTVSVHLEGVTFGEAIELLTKTHGLFYKVERSSAVTVGAGSDLRD